MANSEDTRSAPSIFGYPSAAQLGEHGVSLLECDDHQRFSGARAGLVAAGIIPEGQPFPGDVPGQRVKFFDARGHRVTMAKWPDGTFSARVHLTKADRDERALSHALNERRIALTARIMEMEKSADEYRRTRANVIRGWVPLFVALMSSGKAAIGPGGRLGHEAWSFDREAINDVRRHFEAIVDVVERGYLRHNLAPLKRAVQERDALVDDGFQTMLSSVLSAGAAGLCNDGQNASNRATRGQS